MLCTLRLCWGNRYPRSVLKHLILPSGSCLCTRHVTAQQQFCWQYDELSGRDAGSAWVLLCLPLAHLGKCWYCYSTSVHMIASRSVLERVCTADQHCRATIMRKGASVWKEKESSVAARRASVGGVFVCSAIMYPQCAGCYVWLVLCTVPQSAGCHLWLVRCAVRQCTGSNLRLLWHHTISHCG